MKRIGMAVVCLSVMGTVGTGYAQPNISREDIPADAPADVRQQIERLYSPDPLERAFAARALGQMKTQAAPAIPFLMGMLDDEARPRLPLEAVAYPGPIGLRAARALGRIGEPALPSLMKAVLNDEDRTVRERAAAGIGLMIRRFAAMADPEPQKVSAIVRALIIALKDEHSTTRVRAADGFRYIDDTRAIDPLIEALKDQSAEVRAAAVTALGRRSAMPGHSKLVAKPRGLQALIGALDDQEAEVQHAALRALKAATGYTFGEDGMKWRAWWNEHREEIFGYVWEQIARLHSPDPRERGLAIRELQEMEAGADPAVPFLVALLGDPAKAHLPAGGWNHRIGWLAAMALSQVGQPALEPLLKAALNDEAPKVRENAAKALRRMTRTLITTNDVDKDSNIAQRLINTLHDEHATTRARAAYVLGPLHDSSTDKALIAALKDENADVGLAAVWALGDALVTVEPGKIDKPHVVQPLIAALDHQESEFQYAVRGVLKRLTGYYFEDSAGWLEWWEQNKESIVGGGSLQ